MNINSSTITPIWIACLTGVLPWSVLAAKTIDHGQRDRIQQQAPASQGRFKSGVMPQPGTAHQQFEDRPAREVYNGPFHLGGYFGDRHREAAREYYDRPENRGFCPPGLAKKHPECLPPGHARKWQRGQPLPKGAVYYDLPRSMVIHLGVPPSGTKYVRMGSDILLIALGTSIVVDAIEDMVR